MLFKYTMSKCKQYSTFSNKVMEKIPKRIFNYETCIDVLNSLQSNGQYIKSKLNKPSQSGDTLVKVQKYLARTGITLDKLDELSVIHVAGTKGKGTTCAFTESILRHHGYKTGFFSSPHLLEVRERFRINGKPIERHEFAKYFSKVFDCLDSQKNDENDMPLYFRFLTIMAFMMFLEKKVDVAIIEVGIGGEFDCTNILRKVPVVGITSLGTDHTALLGKTIESIAWNKAGIMKAGCKAFTVPQPEAAMNVLRERSIEKHCELEIVKRINFRFPENTTHPSHILTLNAGLAVALSEAWLSSKRCHSHDQNQNGYIAINHKSNSLSKEITEKALSDCVWPGRYQVVYQKNITYFLDGAHTIESIKVCANWFKDITKHSPKPRALMFNVTSSRDSEEFLRALRGCNFNTVLFVSNTATNRDKPGDVILDIVNRTTRDEALMRCEQHRQLWFKVEQQDVDLMEKANVVVFPTVLEGIEALGDENYDLLVTGSLHLIGSVLSIIEPNLND